MRQTLVLMIVAIVARAGAATAEDPVYFADARLKMAVEEALWISDPTPTDMLGLTDLRCIQYVTGTDTGITDLTGLEYATNLQILYVRWNQVSDLSPLSSLRNLRSLYLTRNRISDLSPLSGLDNLRDLDLHGNQVSDISPLSGLDSLETLTLRINQISDISALSGLGNLRTLILWHNQISDISALAGLTNLRELDIQSNRVSDLSALVGLTSLRDLDIRDNPLSDEACDIQRAQIEANNPGVTIQHDCGPFCLSISSTPGGSVTNPGQGDFIYTRGETLLLTAEPDFGFVFLNWSGSYGSTQNPALLTVSSDCNIQANFVDVLQARGTLCVDDDALCDPGPNDAQRSDPQENGTAAHPFDSIQEAMDLADEGASIVVRPGMYRENIDFRGKSLRLIGIAPEDPNEPGYPVLDGGGAGPVVSFTGGEDPNCLLAGFVLSGGQGPQAGAILCSHSSPTISNCLVVGNRATDPNGAAIYCTDSNAVFVNCTVADNVGGFHAVDSNLVLVNSIVWGNGPSDIVVRGDGSPLVSYSDVSGGWPGLGNLDADPLFAQRGCWADPDAPGVMLAPENLRAVWVAGDYHLKSQGGRWDPETQTWVVDEVTSPGIDAGDPLDSIGQEPDPNDGIINLGAYGGTTGASVAPGK